MDKAITHYDRDNDFTVTLKKNGTVLTALEMGDITKFEIKYNGEYYNSVDDPTGFTITAATGSVLVKPTALELPISSGDIVEVIVYTATDTNGRLWEDFTLKVTGKAIKPE